MRACSFAIAALGVALVAKASPPASTTVIKAIYPLQFYFNNAGALTCLKGTKTCGKGCCAKDFECIDGAGCCPSGQQCTKPEAVPTSTQGICLNHDDVECSRNPDMCCPKAAPKCQSWPDYGPGCWANTLASSNLNRRAIIPTETMISSTDPSTTSCTDSSTPIIPESSSISSIALASTPVSEEIMSTSSESILTIATTEFTTKSATATHTLTKTRSKSSSTTPESSDAPSVPSTPASPVTSTHSVQVVSASPSTSCSAQLTITVSATRNITVSLTSTTTPPGSQTDVSPIETTSPSILPIPASPISSNAPSFFLVVPPYDMSNSTSAVGNGTAFSTYLSAAAPILPVTSTTWSSAPTRTPSNTPAGPIEVPLNSSLERTPPATRLAFMLTALMTVFLTLSDHFNIVSFALLFLDTLFAQSLGCAVFVVTYVIVGGSAFLVGETNFEQFMDLY